jgi:hypothetical protein
MVRGYNPGGGDIFHTRPDRPSIPPAPFTKVIESFLRVTRSGRGHNHQPSSNAKVKERLFPFCAFMACYGMNFNFCLHGLTFCLLSVEVKLCLEACGVFCVQTIYDHILQQLLCRGCHSILRNRHYNIGETGGDSLTRTF